MIIRDKIAKFFCQIFGSNYAHSFTLYSDKSYGTIFLSKRVPKDIWALFCLAIFLRRKNYLITTFGQEAGSNFSPIAALTTLISLPIFAEMSLTCCLISAHLAAAASVF